MNTSDIVDITIIVILDKSGSMKVLGNETMEALQGFLDGLPQVSFDTHKISKRIVICSFNENVSQEIDHTYTGNYTLSLSYIPNGMTAALDGIGFTLATYIPLVTSGKTYVVIVSDGLENASQVYNKNKVLDLINQSKGKGWEFIFLGANIDAFCEGNALNINHCGQFNQSVRGDFTGLLRGVSDAICRTQTNGSEFEIQRQTL